MKIRIGIGVGIHGISIPLIKGIVEDAKNVWLWNDGNDILWGDKQNIELETESNIL